MVNKNTPIGPAIVLVFLLALVGSLFLAEEMSEDKRTLNKIAVEEGYDNVETIGTGHVYKPVSAISAMVGECTVTINRWKDRDPDPDLFVVSYFAEGDLYRGSSLTDSYQIVKSRLSELYVNQKAGCNPQQPATR